MPAGAGHHRVPGAHGEADYLLYVDGKAIGVVEAKPVGYTLKGVEGQSASYADGLAAKLPAWRRPLPFQYESSGEVTQFTNWMEPHARSRDIFQFHRPETLREMVQDETAAAGLAAADAGDCRTGLWPKQLTAITNVEKSLKLAKPKALIQMATGSGKTFTAANIAYRLIKHADARRVCFLVDRTNLGMQTLKEFQQFQPPARTAHVRQALQHRVPARNQFDPVNRVIVTTIQRLYSVLTGAARACRGRRRAIRLRRPRRVQEAAQCQSPTTQRIPPEFFDVIIVDECHRSIYSVWGDVLKYFDAFLIGLTATPSKQTIGFFDREPGHGVHARPRPWPTASMCLTTCTKSHTRITAAGIATSTPGTTSANAAARPRAERQAASSTRTSPTTSDQLDRSVVAEDQIRTVDSDLPRRLFTEIFPGRTEVPKTIIFAKDDSHADDIVRIVREEFGRGNDFCQKITYRTGVMRLTRQGDRPRRQRSAKSRRLRENQGQDGRRRAGRVPQLLQPAHRRHRGHDRHRHRREAGRDRLLHAFRQEPQLLRADEGPRRPRHARRRAARASRRAPRSQDPLRASSMPSASASSARANAGRSTASRTKSLKQVLDYIKAGGTDPDAACALAGKLTRLSADMTDEQQRRKFARTPAAEASTTLVGELVSAIDDGHIEAKAKH